MDKEMQEKQKKVKEKICAIDLYFFSSNIRLNEKTTSLKDMGRVGLLLIVHNSAKTYPDDHFSFRHVSRSIIFTLFFTPKKTKL